MSQTYFQTALTLGLLGHKNAMVFVQFSSDLRIHSRYVRKDITISKINLTNDICVFFVFLEAACCYFMAGRGNFLTHIKLQLTSVIIHENLYCAGFWLPFWQLLKLPIQWLQMQVKNTRVSSFYSPKASQTCQWKTGSSPFEEADTQRKKQIPRWLRLR